MGKGGSLTMTTQQIKGSSGYSTLEIDPDTLSEKPRILAVLASIFDQVVAHNEADPVVNASRKLTVFHGLRAPNIDIDKYLERIFKYANCSPACFVVAYIYTERMLARDDDMAITSLNVHRLLITTVMLAAKFLDDSYFNNAYYAKVGGVTTGEMNRLEMELLFRMDFRLNVTTDDFYACCKKLEAELWRSRVNVDSPPAVIDISALSSMKAGNVSPSTTLAFHSCHVEAEKGVRTPPRDSEKYRFAGVTARIVPQSP